MSNVDDINALIGKMTEALELAEDLKDRVLTALPIIEGALAASEKIIAWHRSLETDLRLLRARLRPTTSEERREELERVMVSRVRQAARTEAR